MSRKIISISIKTLDEKNHVRFWTEKDIDLDSIKFKVDQKAKPAPKPAPKEETPGEPKKDTKPSTKKTTKKPKSTKK